MIISAWWLRASSKFGGQEFEEMHRNIRSLEAPKQVRIPLKYCILRTIRRSVNKLVCVFFFIHKAHRIIRPNGFLKNIRLPYKVTIVQLAKEKMSLVNIAVASCFYCSLLRKTAVCSHNNSTGTGF